MVSLKVLYLSVPEGVVLANAVSDVLHLWWQSLKVLYLSVPDGVVPEGDVPVVAVPEGDYLWRQS